jgi:hypothetical protein
MGTEKSRAKIQIIWGVALVLAGIGVLYRIPQVVPQLAQIEQFASAIGFIYFCCYFIAVTLIIGGGRKFYQNYKSLLGEDKKE